MGLSESSLEDYVENTLHNRVLVVDKISVEVGLSLSRLLYDDLAWLTLKDSLNLDILLNRRHCENHSA